MKQKRRKKNDWNQIIFKLHNLTEINQDFSGDASWAKKRVL
jgi:hypothetical protein